MQEVYLQRADILGRKQLFVRVGIILTLLFGIAACNDNVDPVKEPVPVTLAVTEFPHVPGTRWTYTVYDSLTGLTDTAMVSITGNTELINNVPVQIWVTARGSVRDTSYVAVRGNTVEFYATLSSNNPETLVFPLAAGSSWGTSTDTNTVAGIDMIVTPSGTFDESFDVLRRAFGMNYALHTHTWLVPHVGIVMRTKIESDFSASVNETWSLVSKTEE